MRVGVAFFKGEEGGIFSRLIIAFQGRPYSHVELYRPDSAMIGADGRERYECFSAYEGDGGVRTKMIHLDPVKWDRFEVEAPDYLVEEMWRWCKTQEGLGYDWAGILGFVAPWRRQHPMRWFCSEVCLAALQILFENLKGEVPAKTAPTKLWKILRDKKLLLSAT